MGDERSDDTLRGLLVVFADSHFSWISTVRPDGRPHSVPICHVLHRGRVYLATPARSVKVANLHANPHVSVAAYLANPEGGLIIEGLGVLRPDLRAELSPLFERKYEWDLTDDDHHDALIEVTPTKLSAWGEHGEGRWSGADVLRVAQEGDAV